MNWEQLLSQWVAFVGTAMAVSAISVTVTRSTVFKPLREWLEKKAWLHGKIAELFSCPYCFSHWVSFAGVGTIGVRIVDCPLPIHYKMVVDFLVTAFAMVSLAAFISGYFIMKPLSD